MQPMKLNNIQTGFKRILLTVAAVFMLGNGWAQDAKVLKGRIVNAEGEPIAGAVVNVVGSKPHRTLGQGRFLHFEECKTCRRALCKQRRLSADNSYCRL